jgi:GTP cyclohydrolase I
MDIAQWLYENVTQSGEALAWFGRGADGQVVDADEAATCERRIAKGYRELLSGYSVDSTTVLKTTRMLAPGERPALVTVEHINFFSICAHHFLPFFGQVSITYRPGDRILGLGKFPRLVQAYSRRFQIQEDLVRDLALEVMSSGHAQGVRVVSDARHLCMCSRGPSDHTVSTRTEYTAGHLE